MTGWAGSPVTGTLYFDSIYGYDAIPAPPSGGTVVPTGAIINHLKMQGLL
jgi:hypothetical protein